MTYLGLVLVITLATYRATKFINSDSFPPMEWLRDKLAGPEEPITFRDGEEGVIRRGGWVKPPWNEVFTCAWCISMYVAAVFVVIAAFAYTLPAPFFVWLTASGATGFLAKVEPDD